jgi:hypothetical protein
MWLMLTSQPTTRTRSGNRRRGEAARKRSPRTASRTRTVPKRRTGTAKRGTTSAPKRKSAPKRRASATAKRRSTSTSKRRSTAKKTSLPRWMPVSLEAHRRRVLLAWVVGVMAVEAFAAGIVIGAQG